MSHSIGLTLIATDGPVTAFFWIEAEPKAAQFAVRVLSRETSAFTASGTTAAMSTMPMLPCQAIAPKSPGSAKESVGVKVPATGITTGAIGPLRVSVTVTVPVSATETLVVGSPKGGKFERLPSPASTNWTVSIVAKGVPVVSRVVVRFDDVTSEVPNEHEARKELGEKSSWVPVTERVGASQSGSASPALVVVSETSLNVTSVPTKSPWFTMATAGREKRERTAVATTTKLALLRTIDSLDSEFSGKATSTRMDVGDDVPAGRARASEIADFAVDLPERWRWFFEGSG